MTEAALATCHKSITHSLLMLEKNIEGNEMDVEWKVNGVDKIGNDILCAMIVKEGESNG
jgi:hypothetical protein